MEYVFISDTSRTFRPNGPTNVFCRVTMAANGMEIKLIVLGSGGVGKSAINIYYVQHYFIKEYDPSIEDIFRKRITINETEFFVDILDTAGQDEFNSMREPYMRHAQGFLLVYSVADKNSFDELPILIEQIFRARDADYVPMVIIGNKCDLESDRKVETKAGENLANEHKAAFFETSAKFGINIDEPFETVTAEIAQNRTIPENTNNIMQKKKACIVC